MSMDKSHICTLSLVILGKVNTSVCELFLKVKQSQLAVIQVTFLELSQYFCSHQSIRSKIQKSIAQK